MAAVRFCVNFFLAFGTGLFYICSMRTTHPQPSDLRFPTSFEEFRDAWAAEEKRKGLAGAIQQMILRLLNALVAMLAEARARRLEAAAAGVPCPAAAPCDPGVRPADGNVCTGDAARGSSDGRGHARGADAEDLGRGPGNACGAKQAATALASGEAPMRVEDAEGAALVAGDPCEMDGRAAAACRPRRIAGFAKARAGPGGKTVDFSKIRFCCGGSACVNRYDIATIIVWR